MSSSSLIQIPKGSQNRPVSSLWILANDISALWPTYLVEGAIDNVNVISRNVASHI